MAHANNWKQHSEQKPEFADYTVAGTDEGRHSAALLRINYEAQRAYIRTGRSLRRICRATSTDPRANNQGQPRAYYPKKRERDEDIPSSRGVPHSKFLKRFKLTYNRAETVCKIWVLHATRGWKVYA